MFPVSTVGPCAGAQDLAKAIPQWRGARGVGEEGPMSGGRGRATAAPASARPPPASRCPGIPAPSNDTAGPLCLQYGYHLTLGAVSELGHAEVIGGSGLAKTSLGTSPW